MSETFRQLLDESIQLELNLAKLYTAYNDLFTEDEDFWWDLAMEERGHASLLQQEKTAPQQEPFFPENLLATDLDALKAINKRVLDLVAAAKSTPPSRGEALRTAYELETSAGESHFQRFMESPASSFAANIFQQLNQGDRDHAERIQRYIDEQAL